MTVNWQDKADRMEQIRICTTDRPHDYPARELHNIIAEMAEMIRLLCEDKINPKSIQPTGDT